MKYNSRKRWSVDLEVVSDHALSAAEAEYCLAELQKAVSGHGGVELHTDGHRYHSIDIWADTRSDIKAIIQIVADMCSEGCTVACWDGYDIERRDYLTNFRYRLNHCNDH